MVIEKPSSKRRRGTQIGWHLMVGMAIVLSSLLLTWTEAFAGSGPRGEGSLLEKLHEKEILTDQEYGQLREREAGIDKVLKYLGGLSVGTLAYVDFSGGEKGEESYNRFTVTRGYINIKKKLTPWLGFRITPDAHQDDTGDFKLRLKYLYAEFAPPDVSFLTNMKAEVGLGHMPWLDFEEHINPYRCQGTMFIERAGTFNSADIGVSMRGYLGGQLDKEYRKKVSKYYAGRYGSWHLGVYNGGGYHAPEANEDKTAEVRMTLRPLPELIPGLQMSYLGLVGKVNQTADNPPDYNVNLAMLSYQNHWIILAGQFVRTLGNNKGSLVVPGTSASLAAQGYSIFFNTKLPVCDRQLNLFARYDHFDPDIKDRVTSGDDSYDILIGGLAWEFYHHWYLLLAYEQTMYQKNSGGRGKVPSLNENLPDDWKVQTVLQIKFS